MQPTPSETEEPEGLDTGVADGWGNYPLDAVFVRTEQRTVSEVVKRIENERYVLDPDFQRDFVWPVLKQSKLIESCVMRIPLPVFYVAEATDGRIIVVDGLQRLTTFVRFVKNQFRLNGLANEAINTHSLEGKFFKELTLTLQERVLDTQLTMYILDAKAPERARLDIFERVNSGEPLTRQQMRNALYAGPATAWLKGAAEGDAFRSATGRSLNPKTMRDREAINRFCAFFLLGSERYTTGEMDDFLAAGLKALGTLSDAERSQLRTAFDRAMSLNRELFGEHSFRKSLASPPHASRTVVNVSLFEVCAATMARLGSLPDATKAQLKAQIVGLLRDDAFLRAITYSTNSTAAVRTRFDLMGKVVTQSVAVDP